MRQDFPSVRQNRKKQTYLNHYENGMDLYGFYSAEERNLFFDLLKVDGVGPKAAVKIMSSISLKELVSILESGEVGLLEKIPGIGKKTAAKMLLTLKGKLTIPETETIRVQKTSEYDLVVSSLTEMGYDRNDCQRAVEKIAGALNENPEFAAKTKTEKEDAVFRAALMEMAR